MPGGPPAHPLWAGGWMYPKMLLSPRQNKPKDAEFNRMRFVSLFLTSQVAVFWIYLYFFVVSTLHVGFWPDFAPPSGSVKDGPKGQCPRLCCVLLSRQVTQTHCHHTPCHPVATLCGQSRLSGPNKDYH